MVKAVLFDMNGIFVHPREKKIIEKVATIKRIDKLICYTNYYLLLWRHQKGFYSPEKFWSRVIPGLTKQEYRSLVLPEFEKPFEKNEFMYFQAQKLKEKFPLYCLSNSNFLQGKEYRKQKLYSVFKEIFLSHEIGLMKPFPSFFEHFLNKKKLKPKECLFIDDSPVNVLVAKIMGFKTILFKTNSEFKEELGKFIH